MSEGWMNDILPEFEFTVVFLRTLQQTALVWVEVDSSSSLTLLSTLSESVSFRRVIFGDPSLEIMWLSNNILSFLFLISNVLFLRRVDFLLLEIALCGFLLFFCNMPTSDGMLAVL